MQCVHKETWLERNSSLSLTADWLEFGWRLKITATQVLGPLMPPRFQAWLLQFRVGPIGRAGFFRSFSKFSETFVASLQRTCLVWLPPFFFSSFLTADVHCRGNHTPVCAQPAPFRISVDPCQRIRRFACSSTAQTFSHEC